MSMHNTLKKILVPGLMLLATTFHVVGQEVHNEVQVINWSELKKKSETFSSFSHGEINPVECQ